ncbi:unnamed protein product [Prorocentrum cordatum]|uniref:2OG-Fe(II) oxygenase n=1 Tax=Prorocentrum cordatum TaxID=2364126 RepID=A0ABN9VUQ5_9DINO|nr:unnamed protein product [Polarella glacialis]
MSSGARSALGAALWAQVLLAGRPGCASAQQQLQCQHCDVGDGFAEFLKDDVPAAPGSYASDVHVLWPAHVEVVPITADIGGWETPSFHESLAQEAIAGWRRFREEILPSLPKDHHYRRIAGKAHAGSLNDAFFHFQKDLFENSGDVQAALGMKRGRHHTPSPYDNSTWPEMNGLPAYNKLRHIIDRLSRRYLERSGLNRKAAASLNYSIFNWAAVHGAGEFHGPHTHVGEYHVGVFYAQAGPSAGKLRFSDARGHSPPFGRAYVHTPRSGELVLFPSWLSHMATVTAPASDLPRGEKEPLRVVFSFNIGPVQGPLPCHLWFSDPTGDMRFRRRSPIDPRELAL